MRGDREEISLSSRLLVEVRQAVQEADERFLDHVLASGPVAQSAVGKRQQPAFVAGDELLPRLRVAGADLLDQQAVAVGGHHVRLPGAIEFGEPGASATGGFVFENPNPPVADAPGSP